MENIIKSEHYYTEQEIVELFGGKIANIDCSYITITNEHWDNDILLYIQGRIEEEMENRYMVSVAN